MNTSCGSDPNNSGDSDIADPISLLGFLFTASPSELACEKAGDSNNDGNVDVSDPIYLLNFLFAGGDPLDEPFGACGRDPKDDELPCEHYDHCGP